MRLEDYQRWLDSQFLEADESEKPAPDGAQADKATVAGAEAPPDQPEAAASHNTSQPAQETAHAATEQQSVSGPVSAEANASQTAKRLPTVEPTAIDDVSFQVPEFESYFPRLRSRMKREEPAPVTEAAPAAPAEDPTEPSAAAQEANATTIVAPDAEAITAVETATAESADTETEPAPDVATEPIELAAQEPAAETAPSDSEAASADAPAEANETLETAADAVAPDLQDESAAAAPPAQGALDLDGLDPVEPPPAEQAQSPVRKKARHARNVHPADVAEMSAADLWSLVPRHLQSLIALGNDEVAQNSYTRQFKETRIELVEHLLDPTLSLEETARLLNVCPATVRRYTNRGLLAHQRTAGDQRRFKLSDVLAFMEAQSRGNA